MRRHSRLKFHSSLGRTIFGVLLWCSAIWATRINADERETVATGGATPVARWLNDVAVLQVEPKTIQLHGLNRRQSIIVTARMHDGSERDVTRDAEYQVANTDIGKVFGATFVSQSSGETSVRIRLGAIQTEISVASQGVESPPSLGFVRDVMPVLSKAGCNSGGCHGRAAGQNGFKLSVFGFDPIGDYTALIKESRGRRLNVASPEQSLLLTKPTGLVPHGGGVRMSVDSPDFEILSTWIRQGMPIDSRQPSELVGIRAVPGSRILRFRDLQQIQVTAIYSDGLERDVTSAVAYSSNSPQIADVDRSGLVRSGEVPGEAAITVAYMGHVAAVRTLIPRPDAPVIPNHTGSSTIDQLVWQRLKTLGTPPSELADDATFLRRLALDTIGRTVSTAEIREFLRDTSLDKRSRMIERILNRDDYARFWSMKWSDILMVDRQKLGDRGAYEFRRWLHHQFATNRPYDEWVRSLITATGDSGKVGAVNLFRGVDSHDGLARVTAQAFLGVRLECAQCHHHPFDQWSQDDFFGLAGFFNGLQRQPVGTGRTLVYHAGLRETRIPVSNRLVPTRVLGGPAVTSLDGDPRAALADWMTSPANPWFARMAANRIWKHFFGRGLVESEDDMRTTNPASNEPLLDYLAERLVEQKFDQKELIREILESQTYQLSSGPNDYNRDDEQNFSRRIVRRLAAEVLLDAISDVTEVPEEFPGQPPGTRAVSLWDNRLPSYFLEIFGRPERTSPCECGRSSEPTIAQALHLMNAPEIEARVTSSTGRAARLAQSDLSEQQILDEICLATVGRYPNGAEREIAHDLFTQAPRSEAAVDLLWVMLNSRDFVFVR